MIKHMCVLVCGGLGKLVVWAGGGRGGVRTILANCHKEKQGRQERTARRRHEEAESKERIERTNKTGETR